MKNTLLTLAGLLLALPLFAADTTTTTGSALLIGNDNARISSLGGLEIRMVSDVTTAQYGSVLMNDASADNRFDIAASSSDAPIGVLTDKTGATVQGTTYSVCIGGYAYVAPGEDETVTRGYIAYASTSAAGYAKFSATVGGANHNAELGHNTESCTAYTISSTTGVDTGTETITVSGTHGWAAGTAVIYWNSGGTSIGGLTDGRVYWVISPSGTTLKLSETPGGSAVNLTSSGDDDTQYLMKLPLCVVHWN